MHSLCRLKRLLVVFLTLLQLVSSQAVVATSTSTDLLVTSSSSTSAATTEQTLIWVTQTQTVGGALITTVVQVPYTQTFYSLYTSISEPSSGSVGLGTIKGTVGVVKSLVETTITAAGPRSGGYDGLIGWVACFTATFFGFIMGTGSLFYL